MKTLEIIRKRTNAKTTYFDMQQHELKGLLSEIDLAVQVSELLKDPILFESNKSLPRQSTGKFNSVESFLQGVQSNFNRGQYDISIKQIGGIEKCFEILNSIHDEFKTYKFEEVMHYSKIYKKPVPLPDPTPTFRDLFQIN